MLAQPDQHRRDETAVLAHPVDHVVAGPGEQEVLVDPGQLVGLADPGEEVLVGLGLPARKRAGPGAGGAALLAVDAVGGAELLLEVERLVAAGLVVVAEDIVGQTTTQPEHPVHSPVSTTSS